jgi:hypothetical protein
MPSSSITDGSEVRQLQKESEPKGERAYRQLPRQDTAKAFYVEMKRFLPSTRVAQILEMNLQRTMLSECADLIRETVLPKPPL